MQQISLRSLAVVFGLTLVATLVTAQTPSADPNTAPQARIPTPRPHNPALRHLHDDGTYTSENWSGYAITGPNGSVSSASASWIVPPSTCAPGSSPEYASFWVGIDGWSSNSVQQIGTDSDCSNGTPAYYAWYEFYPQPSYNACPPTPKHSRTPPPCPLMSLRPGDHMSASVTYSGGVFTATITDEDMAAPGNTFTVTFNGSPARNSAEWIAEAPCCGKRGSELPLANFGTVTFTGVDATVSGVPKSIGLFLPQPVSFGTNGNAASEVNTSATIDVSSMVTPSGAAMATPSALFSDSSFSINWNSVGP